jgi:hypothetical protein
MADTLLLGDAMDAPSQARGTKGRGMYIPVWLLVLIVAPWALYAAFALAILLGMYVIIAAAQLGEALSAGLAVILYPFRRVGPWFDYAAAAGMLAALVGVAVLLA